ncbi:MAG: glycosyltransferase family 39 protein [Terriglobales bacterium]
MFEATEFQYTSFDLLWMVAIVYCLARLLRRGDTPVNERWWIVIGGLAGVGLETKYSMAFYLVALALGLLLTPARRYFRSRWLWYGVGVAFLIALPNLVWQWRHDWISLSFLRFIHARDIGEGRGQGFWLDQFRINAPLLVAPLWIAGAVWLFPQRRFRLLGWAFALVVAILWGLRGRGYYTAAVYPPALAAGAVWWEGALRATARLRARVAQAVTLALLLAGGFLTGRAVLPLGAASATNYALRRNGDLREEIGWNEMVREVARIWNQLPASQRGHAVILTFNYGETCAIDLLGPRYGLPQAVSPVKSFWYRGYGGSPPETEIVLGVTPANANALFQGGRVAGHDGNRYGIHNEESDSHPEIFLCGRLRGRRWGTWPALWKYMQYRTFG